MRFLILGAGDEEHAWADTISAHAGHSVVARWMPTDTTIAEGEAALDGALADPQIDAVLVGGPPNLRGDWLQRVAMRGVPAICLHPPGETADAYYQVALAQTEAPALIVPAMPLRLHPAIGAMRDRLAFIRDAGSQRLRLEVRQAHTDDLVLSQFSRLVDAVVFLLGDFDSVSATGWPRGQAPSQRLAVSLTAREERSAEIDIDVGSDRMQKIALTVYIQDYTLMIVWAEGLIGKASLTELSAEQGAMPVDFAPWESRRALLDACEATWNQGRLEAPTLDDGIRAMELTDAVRRSLRRGRTVDVLRDEISELSSFKANMASLGCGVILLSATLYILSRIGLALGIDASKYLAWSIVPLLVVFGLLQFLRLAVRPTKKGGGPQPPAG